MAAAVLIVALLLFAGLVRWATRPQQVAELVLSQTGRALGLEIRAKGVSEYALRGMPRIVLRDVEARMPGDAQPVLRAERISLSMPWTTLRSRGRDRVIHRVELDAPRLDLPALQRWQATRPPTDRARAPRLTDGLAIRRGRVDAGAWHVESIDADVPVLAADRPVRAHLRGRVVAGSTGIPFDVRATLSRPAEGAGLGVAGTATVVRPDWRLALDLVLRGVPRVGDVLTLDGLALGARAVHATRDTRRPFLLGLGGRLRYDRRLVVEPLGLALRRGGVVPTLDASGRLEWRKELDLGLEGRLARWPREWPALPPPLVRPARALPFNLRYRGALDLSAPAELDLRDGATRFHARFRLPRVLDWHAAAMRGTPIPPLDGRLSTPVLQVPGATLHGVEIEINGGDAR
jgi:hypothetical protein